MCMKLHIFKVYNLMSVGICNQLCNYHHSQDNEHSRHLQKHPAAPRSLFIYFEQVVWLFTKTFVLVSLVMLVRATLPRLSSKSLMKFSWYALLPLSIVNFLVVIIFKFFFGGGSL